MKNPAQYRHMDASTRSYRHATPDFSADWPGGIFEAILTAINNDRWRYAMAQPKEKRPPVPTAEQLRQLLEVAILASLEKEEGRPADFSLVFATPEQTDSIPFASSEPFTAELIRRLRSFGHGGTVVALCDGKLRGVQSGREFAPPMRDLVLKVEMARAALQKEADAMPGASPRSLMEGVAALRDLQTGGLPTGETGAVLKTIARFTQVEGALLMDSRFQALRVGAKCSTRGQVRTWFLWKVEGGSEDETLVHGIDGDFAGTRHSSALRFVSRNPGCLAFTCSQDGSLTLFVGRKSEPPKVLVELESLLS